MEQTDRGWPRSILDEHTPDYYLEPRRSGYISMCSGPWPADLLRRNLHSVLYSRFRDCTRHLSGATRMGPNNHGFRRWRHTRGCDDERPKGQATRVILAGFTPESIQARLESLLAVGGCHYSIL